MTQTDNPSDLNGLNGKPENLGLIGRLRSDTLFVASAIGTALTVISTLQDTLAAAAWARALVDGFQSAASGFWKIALPWLSVSPRPMDVVFLNMALFLAAIAIASLSPRAQTPGSWRELDWRRELVAGVGSTLAVVLFIWAGFNSVYEHVNGVAATQFMAAIEKVKTIEEMEAAALTYMTEISAFAPGVDWFGQVVGLTSGPLQERVQADFIMVMALHLAIILMPFFSVLGVGAIFGKRMDSRKSSRWSWLFLALVAATLALSWISETWTGMCAERNDNAINQLCKLVD